LNQVHLQVGNCWIHQDWNNNALNLAPKGFSSLNGLSPLESPSYGFFQEEVDHDELEDDEDEDNENFCPFLPENHLFRLILDEDGINWFF
jgi:hypothetical protein